MCYIRTYDILMSVQEGSILRILLCTEMVMLCLPMKHLYYRSIPQGKNLCEVTGYKYIVNFLYTSRLVLHHNSSSVNHTVYL